jgi:hypothetical protein
MEYNDFINELEEFLSEHEKTSLNIDDNAEHLINDKEQANYFVKLSKQCQEEIEAIQELVAAEKKRYIDLLEKFQTEQIESINKRKRYYDGALEDFAVRELEGSNKKSIKLPYGIIAIKKQQPQYDYDDEEIINWAKDMAPEFIKTTVKETLNKAELKKQCKVTNGELYLSGQKVPGVTVTHKDDKFEVK